MTATTSAGVRFGTDLGAEDRSINGSPASKRASHR